LCGRCLTDPPPYRRARYGVRYEGELRKALVRFKFYGDLHAGRALSELMIETFGRYFEPKEFDLIFPVPIHQKRLLQRGFNQTVVMAERLSSASGIPLDRRSLRKIKDTPPQVGLPRPERIKNLKGSFGVSRSHRIRDASVLIVDDVATTGSTIREASKTVMRAGAARVDALVLGLRPEPGSVPVVQPQQVHSEPDATHG
jgi:ComF family protein